MEKRNGFVPSCLQSRSEDHNDARLVAVSLWNVDSPRGLRPVRAAVGPDVGITSRHQAHAVLESNLTFRLISGLESAVQALNRTEPILPLASGVPTRQSYDYERHGVTCLFAATDGASG